MIRLKFITELMIQENKLFSPLLLNLKHSDKTVLLQ